jgi:cellulose synthase/poly-beta-1,6-N-acetylglucosamine synthase-like glycosyltransferase
MRYGQTWKYTNTAYIIPGSPSIYRTSVLQHLEIDAPGLIIEDFNMTFEVRHKKLGLVGYNPKVSAVHQDPYTFRDYFKQLKRWNLGFWQTVKRHGIWPSIFIFSTYFFMLELMLYSIFLLFVPALIVWFILSGFQPIPIPIFGSLAFASQLTFFDLIIGIFIVDYLMTIVVAFLEKKPSLLFYGIGFILLRYVDALVFLYSIPLSFITKSTGTWASPTRRTV